MHVGETLAEIQPCDDKERVERGAKPLVLVCIVSKAMCGYDRSVAPSAHLQVIRQYLRESDFFQNRALRVSIAETHSTFTISPKRSDGCGNLSELSTYKSFYVKWIMLKRHKNLLKLGIFSKIFIYSLIFGLNLKKDYSEIDGTKCFHQKYFFSVLMVLILLMN